MTILAEVGLSAGHDHQGMNSCCQGKASLEHCSVQPSVFMVGQVAAVVK